MAYRPLVEGDKVKVMQKDHPRFTSFGEVVCVGLKTAQVRIRGEAGPWPWFKQSDLMVASDDLSSSIYRFQYNEQNDVDDEDECKYIDWDHDDLVERIKELERQLSEK